MRCSPKRALCVMASRHGSPGKQSLISCCVLTRTDLLFFYCCQRNWFPGENGTSCDCLIKTNWKFKDSAAVKLNMRCFLTRILFSVISMWVMTDKHSICTRTVPESVLQPYGHEHEGIFCLHLHIEVVGVQHGPNRDNGADGELRLLGGLRTVQQVCR